MVVGLFVIFETVMLVAFNSQTDRNRATIVFGATVIAGAFALYTYLQGIEERRAQHAHQIIQRWNSAEMLPMRLDSYAFNRKQKYFNKPQVKLPQVVG